MSEHGGVCIIILLCVSEIINLSKYIGIQPANSA